MSFTAPSPKQEFQNRKILEDLQKKQQMLKQNVGPPSISSNLGTNQSFIDNNYNYNYTTASLSGINSLTNSTQRERTALIHAHQNSYGFYITQDSSFGNLVLPVLPRF